MAILLDGGWDCAALGVVMSINKPEPESTDLGRIERWLEYNAGLPNRNISEHRESFVCLDDVRRLVSQVKALRKALETRVQECRDHWTWNHEKYSEEHGCLMPQPHDEACGRCRDAFAALSDLPKGFL